MCQNEDPAYNIGLIPVRLRHMDLVKQVSYFSKHANSQFTHLWHIGHKKMTHCWKWLAERYALSPELAYLKRDNSKDIHFQEMVASGNVLQS